MSTFYEVTFWLIIALGILGALTGLVIFLSCRCLPVWKPAARLVNSRAYKRFFKTHCRLWWVFWALVILHVIAVWIYFFSTL